MNRIRAATTAALAAAATAVALIGAGGNPAGAATVACLTPAALHNAALTGNTAAAHLTVNWAAGSADYITSGPLCQTMFGTGAHSVYWVGARPVPGHGPALWPQTLAASTPSQPLGLAAGHHVFAVPPIRNECGQGDVAVEDHVAGWPPVQTGPGTPQPRTRYFVPGTPGERVGNGRGCFVPPAVRAVGVCPLNCAGRPVLSVTLTNRSPYATIRVIPTVAGRRLPPITVLAGRTSTSALPIRDGARWNLWVQYGYGRWTPLYRLTPDAVVLCPPWPAIQVVVACACGPGLTGSVADLNHTRYAHQVTAVAGGRRWTFVVQPAHLGRVAVAWPRGTPLVVTVQSWLAGRRVGAPVTPATVLVT